jgi:hypothetical protein
MHKGAGNGHLVLEIQARKIRYTLRAQFWSGISKVLAHPRWERVWAMQEAKTAYNTVIYFCNVKILIWYVLGKTVALKLDALRRPWGNNSGPVLFSGVAFRIGDIHISNTKSGRGKTPP